MEAEAVALETRGLWPAQGYGFRRPRTAEIEATSKMAFAMPGPEKALAGRGIVKAASWSDLGICHPEAAWTAQLEVLSAGSKAAQAEVFSAAPAEGVFSAGNKAETAEGVFSAGSKAVQAEGVFAAGNKAAPADKAVQAEGVFAAGNKAAREEAKKTKKILVQVSDDRINFLLEHPPNVNLSHRVRSFTEGSSPLACPNPVLRQSILDKLPRVAALVDKWNEPKLDILRQYHEHGVAYEEIEVDEGN